MPCADSRAKQEKDSSSFLARTQPMRSQGSLFTHALPTPSIKACCFPCWGAFAQWLLMVVDPEMQFFSDPEEIRFCWGNN